MALIEIKMDTGFWNKVIIVIFCTVIALWLLVIVSDSLFDQPYPSQGSGYYLASSSSPIPAAGMTQHIAEQSSDASVDVAAKRAQQLMKQRQELDALFANADLERGRLLFQQCALCHSSTKVSVNRLGPSLWGVVDRPIANLDNFNYSDIMIKFGKEGRKWDKETLFEFLKAPRQYAPGTFMAFFGMSWPQDRVNLISYLRTLTDSNKALNPSK